MTKIMEEVKAVYHNIKSKGLEIIQSKDSSKQKKGFIILLVSILLVGGFMLIRSGGGKEYRQAMALGDSYFEEREYGEAEEAYRKAHELNPKDKKSVENYTISEALGNVWIEINSGEAGTELHDELEEKLPSIENKEVAEAYQEAIDYIEGMPLYETYRSIDERFNEEFGSAN